MRDIELGISLYPEQETKEEIRSYIELASKYGFKRIFTSLFSVEGTKEEVIAYFKELCDIAHQSGMKVIGDANPLFFKQMDADESNLDSFKQMGIDGIRMDVPYGDERDVTLVNNPYNIEIVFSTAVQGAIDNVFEKCGTDRISVCHNFYPQRYSGISFEKFNGINEFFVKNNVKIEAFISSNNKKAHGPWPVWDGLVTVEEMRELPIEAQTRIYILLGTISRITISNAFASEAELKAVKETIDYYRDAKEYVTNLGGVYEVHLSEKRHILDIVLEPGMTEEERKLVFDFDLHFDLGDGFNYFIRSRMGRFIPKLDLQPRISEVKEFKRGDIAVVNDNCRHYKGEVQIVLKPMKNDGQRTLIGHILESELILLDFIGPREHIQFKEYKPQ